MSSDCGWFITLQNAMNSDFVFYWTAYGIHLQAIAKRYRSSIRRQCSRFPACCTDEFVCWKRSNDPMRIVGRGHLSRDFQAFAVDMAANQSEQKVERYGICVLWYS